MRVLHLDSGGDLRGGQHQVLALLEGLGAGHTLLASSKGKLLDEARRRGIDAKALTALTIARLSDEAELVHAHDARSHTLASLLSSRPIVVARRVAFPIKRSVLSRWKYRRAAHFIAVSEFVKRTLLDAQVPERRISVVYDGVRLIDQRSTGERIISIASTDPMKGATLAREAARLGGYTIEESSDLERDLRTASVLVYLSHSEGLGSAALLAMSHGVPVVASNVGGLPEIVEDGITGMLTENEPRSVCAAIERALARREELGRNALCRVRDRYTLEHMVENTQRVYREVLGC